ncbi:MAG TPA: bacillithiol biosynthesis cysteine-adding enzyme BshC [Bacteroidota bacterium]|nr:bacillithiol biosynthesis cysteine-adding enzyme BshC [Bacteroidota bacterium]
MDWIDYKDLPTDDTALTGLFIDYITAYDKVKRFFPGNFRDPASWESILERVSKRNINRSDLTRILSVQNRNFHCGVKALANIDLLRNDNTVAVVTGQQVGLFTGPLYTIYKTITALKLVDSLREQYTAYNFVPVFWLEGEDHDYDEVSSVALINKSNDLVRLGYQPQNKSKGENFGAVGQLELDDSIGELFQRVEAEIVDTEFKPKVTELFRIAYQKGMNFNRSFVHLMNDLLEDSGLVFLDPHDPELKALLVPVFRKELETTPALCQLVIDQSAEVEKSYHAQVKPKPVNLFFFHEGGRYLLEPKPDGFGLKGTRRNFTRQQIFDQLDKDPSVFSPNVVLRPICQDWLLPTAAYIAGPGEISYFAQLAPLYPEFSIPEPIIYPRASATIIEEKVEKVLSRFNIPMPEFLRDIELLKQRIAEQVSEVKLEELFGGTTAAFDEAIKSLRHGLQKIDPTLLGALDTAKSKIDFQLDVLRQKTTAAQKRQHEVALRQVEKAALHLFPFSNFQERELNVLHFLNKYGLEFLRWLHGELVIDKFKHQIIRL